MRTEQEVQMIATFQEEFNGTRWYSRMHDRINQIHSIVLPDGRVIEGSWVAPKYVWRRLATLQGDEREAYVRHLTA